MSQSGSLGRSVMKAHRRAIPLSLEQHDASTMPINAHAAPLQGQLYPSVNTRAVQHTHTRSTDPPGRREALGIQAIPPATLPPAHRPCPPRPRPMPCPSPTPVALAANVTGGSKFLAAPAAENCARRDGWIPALLHSWTAPDILQWTPAAPDPQSPSPSPTAMAMAPLTCLSVPHVAPVLGAAGGVRDGSVDS